MKESKYYWVDENKNAWDKEKYTELQAEELSKTLINCTYCKNCTDCEDCKDCIGCHDCTGCGNENK